MSVADNLRKIREAAWAPMERMIEDAEELVEIRNAAKEQGLDWGPIKALLKARIQDERDGGERVKKLVMKADTASEYAEMLNFMAENKKTPPQSKEPLTPARAGEAVERAQEALGAASARIKPNPLSASVQPPDSGEPAPSSQAPQPLTGGAGSSFHDPDDDMDLRNMSFARPIGSKIRVV